MKNSLKDEVAMKFAITPALLLGIYSVNGCEPTPTPDPTPDPAQCSTGNITTAAGGGSNAQDENIEATTAQLKFPNDVHADDEGNLWIAEYGGHRIRKVDPDGLITTAAGNGTAGLSGDGGDALLAQLNGPSSVLRAGDVLYISDWENGRIRRVDLLTGLISTFAGSIPSYGGDGQNAARAAFLHPTQMAITKKYFYVSDTGNCIIRRIDLTTMIVSTIAGQPTLCDSSGDGGLATDAFLDRPTGLTVVEGDTNTMLYLSEPTRHRIRFVDADGLISTYAGTGEPGYSESDTVATEAQLLLPALMQLHPVHGLFFADMYNERIRQVLPDGTIRTLIGSGEQGYSGDGGPSLSAALNDPQSVTFSPFDNALYVADNYNHRIRRSEFNCN